MGFRFKGAAAPPAPAANDTGDGADDETDEQFEERIYLALMRVARSTSVRLRASLGSCVMLGTPYETASEQVRDAIREFIATAEL